MRKTIFLLISLVMCLSCATMSKEERLQKASAHYQLGKSYLNNNNIQPAFVEFQKALELDPGNPAPAALRSAHGAGLESARARGPG